MTYIPDDDLLDRMHELKASCVPFVCATVVSTKGHTPRKAGAKMLVVADGRLIGTVGGGAVESAVIERARSLFTRPEVVLLAWDLSSAEAGAMVCGGHMEFLLEPFLVRPKAFVFGAGHVGLALVRLLSTLRFDVTVIDDREAVLTAERFPKATLVQLAPKQAAFELPVPAGAFCIIVNRSHTQDLDTLRGLLQRSPDHPRYIGLMSSRRKRAELFGTLEREGVSPDILAQVHTPVGLDIGAETPEEIAVAIAAEMVAELRKSASASE